jgi:hypothetical protein
LVFWGQVTAGFFNSKRDVFNRASRGGVKDTVDRAFTRQDLFKDSPVALPGGNVPEIPGIPGMVSVALKLW